MKALKVLIPVIIVFVVSFSAQAQTTYPLTVNNNTPYLSSADFVFSCGNTFFTCSPYAVNSGTSCTGTGISFDNVTIVITDATCTVPTTYSVTLTSANTSDTYTDCNGNPRTFDLSIGSAYDVTIN